MKDSARHIVFIDYLRAIAILWVFLYHCLIAAYFTDSLPWKWLTRDFDSTWSFLMLLPLHYGYIGVPIFFVVSGFCIHLSFEQQGREWKSFFIRRFFRIYPGYFAAIFIFSFWYAHDARDFWFQFGFHALMIHNFNSSTLFGLGGVFWTIAIEVQLYLLYPLLLWLVGKLGWKQTLVCLVAVEILLHGWDGLINQIEAYSRYYPPYGFSKFSLFVDNYLRTSPLAYWFSWSLGACAADAYLKGRPMPLAGTSTWFWVFLTVISYFLAPLWLYFFTISALLTTKIISNYFTGKRLQAETSGFWLKYLRLIGLWSYSIYLVHQPLLEGLSKLQLHFLPHINPVFPFLFYVGMWLLIFPLAGIWYRFLEQPGIALGKTIIRKMSDKKLAVPVKTAGG